MQSLATRWRILDIGAQHVNIMLTAAAGLWGARRRDLERLLLPLLELLPGRLASQPGCIPDPHPPGAPQRTGLGLHLLEPLGAELKELVLKPLEDGGVAAGWTADTITAVRFRAACCASVGQTEGGAVKARGLDLLLRRLRVGLRDSSGGWALVLL